MTARKESRVADGAELWRCSACLRWLPAANYYADKRTPNGLKAQCRTCHSDGAIRTRDEDKKRDANRGYMRMARAASPERFRVREREAARSRDRGLRTKARSALNSAVRSGDVVRPNACSRCATVTKLHGHHHDYTKPLDVEWLCAECHGLEHRMVVSLERKEIARG